MWDGMVAKIIWLCPFRDHFLATGTYILHHLGVVYALQQAIITWPDLRYHVSPPPHKICYWMLRVNKAASFIPTTTLFYTWLPTLKLYFLLLVDSPGLPSANRIGVHSASSPWLRAISFQHQLLETHRVLALGSASCFHHTKRLPHLNDTSTEQRWSTI